MSRGLSGTIIAELGNNLYPAFFAELDFDIGGGSGSTLRLSNLARDITWGSQSWLGDGLLNDIRSLEESPEIRATGIEIDLAGMSQTVIATVLAYAQQGAIGSVYMGFLNSSGALLDTPFLIFRGKLDTVEITDSGAESMATVSYESELIELVRPRGIRYTNENQQARFAGDRGFEYVTLLEDWNGFWGRSVIPKNKRVTKKRRGGG